MPLRRDPKMIADPTSEEQRYLEQLVTWLKDGTGYRESLWVKRMSTPRRATHRPLGQT
jgi:hypothetical protein